MSEQQPQSTGSDDVRTKEVVTYPFLFRLRKRIFEIFGTFEKVLAGGSLPITAAESSATEHTELPLVTPPEVVEAKLIEPKNGMLRREFNFFEDVEEAIAEFPGVIHVGSGVEHVVLHFRQSPDEVIKYIKERSHALDTSPIETMEVYHLHKVLHRLLPDHFPEIFASRTGSSKAVAKSRWEFVEKSPDNEFEAEREKLLSDAYIVSESLNQKILDCGIKVGIFDFNTMPLDHAKRENFMVDSHGNIKYLDKMILGSQPIELNYSRLNEILNLLHDVSIRREVVHHLMAVVEIEVVKYAWIHNIIPDSQEFALLKGDLDDKSWNRVQTYAKYVFSGAFNRSDYAWCEPGPNKRGQFSLTTGINKLTRFDSPVHVSV